MCADVWRTISSPIWGWIIDKWGRKPVLLCRQAKMRIVLRLIIDVVNILGNTYFERFEVLKGMLFWYVKDLKIKLLFLKIKITFYRGNLPGNLCAARLAAHV